LLSLAVKILKPLEESLQKKYLLEASEKFKASAPFTIAVTGSFGKTSVKNYLGETLQSLSGATFWPSGGTNTLMGITREIRENLNPWHKNAVIEIGAYRPGSIAKVCKELTPPDISIITAINVAHLERFGSLDVTYQAKTEIALALSDKGILITNGDDQLALKAGLEIKKAKNIIYGFSDIPQINCRGSNLKYAKEGTTFTITFEGKSYDIKTKLLGKTAASNLLAVFAAAVCCGVNLDLLPAALSNISPVSNRLTLNKRGSYNFLDDAYNSNEIGFKSALEVMQQIEAPEKIIITPGVIELGDKQFEVNKHLGEIASKVADKIIVVSKTNREAFKAGIEDSRLIIADSREEAFAKLNEIAKPEALVLLENDLTDLHEHEYKF
jgi:UDP-N-acetylmuramoyl-tripeptide--D-alanyl-D-alanine ligase